MLRLELIHSGQKSVTAYQTNPNASNSRILVVDDDPNVLELIQAILERLGSSLTLVETGSSALTLLQEASFDMLILDLILPDIDGFKILERLRNDPQYDSMPILILSARADDDSIARGLELGADAYVTKFYLSHSLAEQVRTLIQRGRTIR